MEKKGKKFMVESEYGFSTSYGTVDQTTNKSVYIDLTSWVEPLFDNDDGAGTYVRRITKRIKDCIYRNLTDNFNKTVYIVDLDLRVSGIRLGKQSFMSCDITLFTDKSIHDLTTDIETLIQVLTGTLYEEFGEAFIFNKNKKT